MRIAITWVLILAAFMLTACDQAEPPTPQAAAPAAAPPEIVEPQEIAKPDEPRAEVEPFEAQGTIIDAHALFASAAGDAQPAAPGVGGIALVTSDGVYSFIETTENKTALAAITLPQAVTVKGMVHHPGRLLHADSITPIDAAPIDLATYKSATGERVTLTGTNKCQCGIKIAELHTSCALGHLHHLAADDGKLYHYLRFTSGDDLVRGRGSHFKNVTVTAALLPGQFLLVESVTQP